MASECRGSRSKFTAPSVTTEMSGKNLNISDNPSIKDLNNQRSFAVLVKLVTGVLVSIGFKGGKIERLNIEALNVIEQSDILEIPDRFNQAFADKGWIATNSMSMEVMRQALSFHDEGREIEAEEVILAWFAKETIELFAILRGASFNSAIERKDQLEEALALTLEERYLAAVPLILIACDGFASDELGTSPFEKDADLSSFDSLVGHPTALPALMRKLVKGVRKTSDEELSLPFRHGILHGRSLGYGNRRVCYKSWMLMIALVDWAHDKRDEENRKNKQAERENLSWRALFRQIRELGETRRALESFRAIDWSPPFDDALKSETPVLAVFEFLEAWKSKNFGAMAERAVNLLQKNQKHLAGELRRDAEVVQLLEFQVRSIRQTTVARAEAIVFLRGQTLTREVQGEFILLSFRHTFDGDVAMPNDDGYWTVQQLCIFNLMHEKTADRQQAE